MSVNDSTNGRIVIVGDLFPTESNCALFNSGDKGTLFGDDICHIFARADLAICNLEGALSDRDTRCVKTGPIKIAPTSAVNAYKELGVDYCMLANNHATDAGHEGMLDTIRTLENKGIKYIGAGENDQKISRSFIQEVGGVAVGFYNVSETMYNKPGHSSAGAWLYDESVVCEELKSHKNQCDYLIVIYHGGIEKFPYPSPETRKRFHRMADCGADMVLSQHTHCIGCEEYYNGSYLLYGQGDFLLKNFAPGLTDEGLLLELVINDKGVQIQKHLVHSVDNRFVRYADKQDLTAFMRRSERVQDEQYVLEEFRRFCKNELRLYLTAFKNPSRVMLYVKRFFPSLYDKWLFSFSRRNLLFVLHTLRSEQNRETAITGLEDLLKSQLK